VGRLAKILSFVRTVRNEAKVSDIKADTGGGANITAEHIAPAGDDSFPLENDYVALNSDSGTGREMAIGYIDHINEPKAGKGDKRIYARNPETGNTVAEFWLQGNGSILCSNENGSFELQSGGDFLINGVTIDTNGNIATAGKVNADDVTADNKNVTLSTHLTPALNQPPTPGT